LVDPSRPRKALPVAVETEVLSSSRRRCSICFGLNRDLEIKQGQIAHLDHNRENHRIDNLVFLCLPDHDQYDSTTSQSKGFQVAEVKRYRQELYSYLVSQFDLFDEDELQSALRDRVLPSQTELSPTGNLVIFYDDENKTCKRDKYLNGVFIQRLWRVGVMGPPGKLCKGVLLQLEATTPHITDLPGILHPIAGDAPGWEGTGSFTIQPGATQYVDVIRYQPNPDRLWITFHRGYLNIGRVVSFQSYTLHLTARDNDGQSASISLRLEVGDGIPAFNQQSDEVNSS